MFGENGRMVADALEAREVDDVHGDELDAEWQYVQIRLHIFVHLENLR